MNYLVDTIILVHKVYKLLTFKTKGFKGYTRSRSVDPAKIEVAFG